MDAAVLQALARWPNVPHCFGWLALDSRGTWWMRNHAGPAQWPRLPDGRLDKADAGPVLHAGLAAFIGRNYATDAHGAWHFQNGPQRVYVSLEVAPWVLRLRGGDTGLVCGTHTGLEAAIQTVWLDDAGRVWCDTAVGPGLIHSQDMPLLAEHLDAEGTTLRLGERQLPLQTLSEPPAAHFGFQPDPLPESVAPAHRPGP